MEIPPRERAEKIISILIKAFGKPEWEPQPPLDELISTVLSQNTNDRNRDLAFQALRHAYPTWESVRDADTGDVIETIRPAGLANQKGPRIQKILRLITEEHGDLSLDFLSQWQPDKVYQWLIQLDGVGPKTASIVMLFSLGMPAFPVDTHVYRVSGRIGLRQQKTSVEDTHIVLAALYDPEEYQDAHILLIYLGRRICHARKPVCALCPVALYCLFPEKNL